MNEGIKRFIGRSGESLIKKPEDSLNSSEEDRKDLNQLGKTLRERRRSLGISVRSAAQRAGIGTTYLWILERGMNPSTGKASRPSRKVLSGLADTLILEEDSLFELVGYEKPEKRPFKQEQNLLQELDFLDDPRLSAEKRSQLIVQLRDFLSYLKFLAKENLNK